MKGLLIKDFLSVRRYSRYFLVLTLLFTILTAYGKNLSIFAGFAPMLAMILNLSVFTYDEYYHWDVFALSFPITRRDLVTSRYLFNLIIIFIAVGICTLIAVLLNVFLSLAPWSEVFGMGIGGFFSSLLLIAITNPAVYHFGVEKGRYFLIAAVLAFMLVFVSALSFISIPSLSIASIPLFFIGIVIACIVLYLLSCKISCWIMAAKDL